MIQIKICGLTNLDDARVALEAGADMLGFNFYRPSPRYISVDEAARIIATLRTEFPQRRFRCVGVFVNAPLDAVHQLQAQCMLDLIQLHGDEPASYCCAVGQQAFKALRAPSAAAAEAFIQEFIAMNSWIEREPLFLIDTAHAQLYGGTGATGNWEMARGLASRYPILLAGGLNPANVINAIRAVRPWGVDVASGVERAPGIKDESKVRQFIRAVKDEIYYSPFAF